MSIIFFLNPLQTRLQVVEIDDIFPVVFEEGLQGFFIPVAAEAFPEAHGFDAVDTAGETLDPQLLFHLLQPPREVPFPTFVHQIAALEIPVQIEFDRLADDREVEPRPVVGQNLGDPFESIPEVGPIHILPHELNDPLGRGEDPDDGNFLSEGSLDVQVCFQRECLKCAKVP